MLCLITISLPKPRIPVPLKITRPGALASTGCPSLPAMPMPFRLALSLKVLTTFPLAGQLHATLSSPPGGRASTLTAGSGFKPAIWA
ncbi:hypothetical protein D3C83_18690 [compost metagenome]